MSKAVDTGRTDLRIVTRYHPALNLTIPGLDGKTPLPGGFHKPCTKVKNKMLFISVKPNILFSGSQTAGFTVYWTRKFILIKASV